MKKLVKWLLPLSCCAATTCACVPSWTANNIRNDGLGFSKIAASKQENEDPAFVGLLRRKYRTWDHNDGDSIGYLIDKIKENNNKQYKYEQLGFDLAAWGWSLSTKVLKYTDIDLSKLTFEQLLTLYIEQTVDYSESEIFLRKLANQALSLISGLQDVWFENVAGEVRYPNSADGQRAKRWQDLNTCDRDEYYRKEYWISAKQCSKDEPEILLAAENFFNITREK